MDKEWFSKVYRKTLNSVQDDLKEYVGDVSPPLVYGFLINAWGNHLKLLLDSVKSECKEREFIEAKRIIENDTVRIINEVFASCEFNREIIDV